MSKRLGRRFLNGMREIQRYVAKLPVDACSHEAQFLILSPPRVSTQFLFDKCMGETFRVKLRAGTTDWPTFEQIFVHRDYDLNKLARWNDIQAAFRAIVAKRHVPLIVDCGANIGLSTLWFSRCFPDAHVLGVEPEANNFVLAQANCPRANASLLRCAVGPSDSTVTLVDSGRGSNAFRTSFSDTAEDTVMALSVPSLIAHARKSAEIEPFLIKIDIEGFETELFAGSTDWIDSFPVLIIELHDWMLPRTANSGSFLRAIAGRSRDFVFHGENVFSIRN